MAPQNYVSKGRMMSNIWRAFKQLNPANVKLEAEAQVRVAVIGPEPLLQDVVSYFLGQDLEAYDRASDVLVLLPTPLDDEALRVLPKCDIVLLGPEGPTVIPGVARERVFAFTSLDDLPQAITRMLKEPSLAELHLPLARALPALRKEVGTEIIQSVSIENSVFVVSTSLGNVIPNPLQPLASVAEGLGDLVVLTANQLRMLFRLAAAYRRDLGYREQMPEMLSIVGAAFGWRSIARELVSKLPFGAGVVPKAGIAFAGTWAVGDGIVYYYTTGRRLSRQEMRQRFDEALIKGRSAVEAAANTVRKSYARRKQSEEKPGETSQ